MNSKRLKPASFAILRRGMLAFLLSLRLSLLILLFVAFPPVHVDSAINSLPFYWEFINVDIEVLEDGDMLVTETQKYVFTAANTNERYRWIPLDQVDDIDNVRVHEEGKQLSATTGIKNNQLWIKWQHNLDPPESHTFVLTYRIRGGLRVYEDGDEVYWKAIFSGRSSTIESGKVTVRLPQSLADETVGYDSFGVHADERWVNFFVSVSNPPGECDGDDNSMTFTLWKDQVDTPLVCEITGSDTQCNVGGCVDFQKGDQITVESSFTDNCGIGGTRVHWNAEQVTNHVCK